METVLDVLLGIVGTVALLVVATPLGLVVVFCLIVWGFYCMER
ncbi:MAG: hypothetical protein UW07_C0004G0001 [Candidatus Nomurabacteria bacterium GW2011_GWF2_43_8]|uniref:Uncharacterized protein n=1 Tax=Candidatus Nomurabacteria bacterium GW2011_GWF2_43_8 TaxID=1618779 RepID=A0A0G1HZD8_9BACT|nr:MAG: hypothetical protein UW07_C0004G0001 [Candidatus Nomurabacteria bacterium GW2011_GWF2_43_8]